ncbi:MAG: methionine ABC transporter ATP-binding protein [Burkholderiales bacterium]
MIEIRDVSKAFGDNVVLDKVSLRIDDGEIFGLIGVSGAGKSTLLRCINRLESIDGGTILVDGVDVSTLQQEGLRDLRRSIGMVFQQFSLMDRKSVYDNVYFPLRCRGESKAEADGKIREMLELVGLSDKLKSRPNELSGGQKQRVAIARALVSRPKFLLCDEATSALDPNITETVLDLLKEINRELGLTIIVVTHEISVMKSVCSKMGLLSAGRLKAVGTVEHFFLKNPALLSEFMSDAAGHPFTAPGFATIRVIQPDQAAGALLSELAISTGIPFTIVSGGIDRYRDSVAGAFNLLVKSDEIPRFTAELTTRGVEWMAI